MTRPSRSPPRAGSTGSGAGEGGALGVWCGAVLIFGAVATPLLAWLAQLGFAPLLALMGLLSLPALRIRREDRPLLIALLAALLWAAVSTLWSPHRVESAEDSTALKLALQLPLYWGAVCGARRASPRLRTIALQILAWGLAAVGVVLIAEAFTGAAFYQWLWPQIVEPIRPDLAARNLARTTFVLALLWPVAAVGAMRVKGMGWLCAPMAVGTVVGAIAFNADAPAIAVALAVVVFLATLRWPADAPKTIGSLAAVAYIVMPAMVVAGRLASQAFHWTPNLPLSWSMRVGYWTHAADWIGDHPLRGWGLEASREFSPGIVLHPHNGPLQAWLELGAVGALMAAAIWWLALSRLNRPKADLVAAAATASAAVYLLFGGINFGLWQEWWLACAALVAVIAAAAKGQNLLRPST
ncbi:O-antigen ligase [Phenylobacterium sp. J367]|uniref:O-antigen ligase family protein n=1 Tax=Phenylobacterium sp. J367 TaxID=2898435 RepID=UPI002151F0BE|nr:O-antigen ligase family protein [Phenylobacterium sp. J367]MCR5879883.1 O-antigen ligase family protein [Phenylobacterium sp. J367]